MEQKKAKKRKKGPKMAKNPKNWVFPIGGSKRPIFARQRSDFGKNPDFGHFGRRDSPAY